MRTDEFNPLPGPNYLPARECCLRLPLIGGGLESEESARRRNPLAWQMRDERLAAEAAKTPAKRTTRKK